MAERKTTISESLIRTVRARLAANRPVRRTLPEKGRLHVDRQLPFLCVYRHRNDDHGTPRLVTGEASYLIASGASRHQREVSALVQAVVKTMVEQFGAYLIVEIWAREDGGRANDAAHPSVPPAFQIIAPKSVELPKTIEVLEQNLRKITVLKQRVRVEVVRDAKCSPPGLKPLLRREEARELNCFVLGLVVPPVYRDPQRGEEFPLLLRSFRRTLGQALKRTFYRFARSQTTHRPPHYHELGRRAVVRAVWEVDRQLGEVSNAFDFLLQVTPVNSDDAWREFEKSGFERAPVFHYRPTPYDPGLLKRQLYQIPLERVEDPALQHILQEKQAELDRKITMLQDRDTPRFLYGGLQLYGAVEDDLLKLAREVLDRIPSRSRDGTSKGQLGATAFAERASAVCDQYRAAYPEFTAKVRVTKNVAGLMVSRGTLLVNPHTTVPEARVDALLQHEVGTHLVTYFNGRAQPFRQLYSGLAGYEELQEGLAVLSEYLVEGLSRPRLRQLAARVVAAHGLVEGASFVETFRALDRTYDFSQRSAFTITMRVYRGGGLTKDAVYLRGLRQVLEYVSGGGELEPLFVGKFALDHLPIIEELQFRKVLKPAPVLPLYMERKTVVERLARLREGPASVLALVDTHVSGGRKARTGK